MSSNKNTSPSSTCSMDEMTNDDDKRVKSVNTDQSECEEVDENNKKHKDLKDQVYQDKLRDIKIQLQHLQNGTHVYYVKKLKELELQREKELMINRIRYRKELENIEREHNEHLHIIQNEFDEDKDKLTESMMSALEEKRKFTDNEHLLMELSLDSTDQKSYLTRKLRRRPHEPEVVVVTKEKRQKPTPIITFAHQLLPDHEINEDVKAIQESLVSKAFTRMKITTEQTLKTVNPSPILKQEIHPITNLPNEKCQNSDTGESSGTRAIKIENGKLLFEKKWYHRGQHVFVLEGSDKEAIPAIISSIETKGIWVKATLDNNKIYISLLLLANGKMSIKRRAAV